MTHRERARKWPNRAASVDLKAHSIGARLGRIRVPAGWSADTGPTQPARLCTRTAWCDGYALALLDALQLSATASAGDRACRWQSPAAVADRATQATTRRVRAPVVGDRTCVLLHLENYSWQQLDQSAVQRSRVGLGVPYRIRQTHVASGHRVVGSLRGVGGCNSLTLD